MAHRTLSLSAFFATAFAASLGLVQDAWGGTKGSWPVQVDLKARTAHGILSSARNGTDFSEFIGCSLTAVVGGLTSLDCYARNAQGTTATCSTTDANLITASLAINGDSAVSFQWDRDNACITLRVVNESPLEPKQP